MLDDGAIQLGPQQLKNMTILRDSSDLLICCLAEATAAAGDDEEEEGTFLA